jgi:hypothetical protein
MKPDEENDEARFVLIDVNNPDEEKEAASDLIDLMNPVDLLEDQEIMNCDRLKEKTSVKFGPMKL